MGKRNDFILPDDLGWGCNDELSEMMYEYAEKAIEIVLKGMTADHNKAGGYLTVLTAEYMDNMYAVIKKYQKKAEAGVSSK